MSDHLFDVEHALVNDSKARAIYERGRQDSNAAAIDRQTVAIERAALTIASAILYHEDAGIHAWAKDGPTLQMAQELWDAAARRQ